MTEARYTLTCTAQALDKARALADLIDEHMAIDALAVTVNETDEKLALWNTVAYFESEASAHEAAHVLAIKGFAIAPVPDVDWVRKSLEGLPPVSAGRFFLHGSHDRDKRRGGGINLEIDAATAFGTGHHGTTAGCLMLLDRILKQRRPQNIFDLGCGTGVLAIAAAAATRQRVLATDIDAEALRVTIDNARLNGLMPQISGAVAAGLHHPAIGASAPYDLIFANILARPLVQLAHGISHLLSPGGIVILSGLTADQKRWVEAVYRTRGLKPFWHVRTENWIAMAMQKGGSKRKHTHINHTNAAGRGWELDL
jgi:ribosomal protein L11 methyltransferase